jgi:hypothetical protein
VHATVCGEIAINLFDYFETLGDDEGAGFWAARAPRRPRPDYDIKLVPRRSGWREDPAAISALGEIERQPWLQGIRRAGEEVRLIVSDEWVEGVGAVLEAGGSAEVSLADLLAGKRFSIQFWDANASKALHAGHLRNLAVGNALTAALAQAGARVERRSLISDAGRSMGEAMAGVLASGRPFHDEDGKSDHFVGICYAEYVAASNGAEDWPPPDSQTRELTPRDDKADELLRGVLKGDRDAIELWYRTRAWVIAGQRKTLARLGVAFDRVYFESDFLPNAAELIARGLRKGLLHRTADGVISYATGLEDFEEFPLVRPDGISTQHLRSLAYWMAQPELDGSTSIQVCGTEWTSHVACRRKLMQQLHPRESAAMHPSGDIFNGMVSEQKRVLASSDGALLIDDLCDWLAHMLESGAEWTEIRRHHPCPERAVAQVLLAFFLPYPVSPRIDFDPEKLLVEGESLGWDLVRARARENRGGEKCSPSATDPAYRFAVIQSELYRRYLRLAVTRLDVRPMAHYLRHLALWQLEEAHGPQVDRVVHTLLDLAARGLGLDAA